MEITYANKKEHKKLADPETIFGYYRKAVAQKILRAMKAMERAETLQEIIGFREFRLHELHGSGNLKFSLDVSANLRLIISIGGKFARKSDGGVDYASVKSVIVQGVRDTHEGKVRRK